jgi:hypothetical protein
MTPLMKDDPIPPLPRPEHAPRVRTDEDVRRRWRSLMGECGFGCSSLWIVWYTADGRQLPLVMPIDDLPPVLETATLQNLIRILAAPASMGAASVALAFSRPGPATLTAIDRGRANAVLAAVHQSRLDKEFDLRLWPIMFATADSVRTLTADDLA